MRLYLDTSALVKLIVEEAETAALRAYLADNSDVTPVASELVRTELRRVALRTTESLLPAVEQVLAALKLVRLDSDLLDAAGSLAPREMRSRDAIHLAAALRVAPVRALVTYDDRMALAARNIGLQVVAPAA